MSVSHRHAGLLPNEREGMSAIAIRFPEMWIGVNRQAFCCFARSANAWTRCSATVNHLDASFVAHLIVGELPLNNVRRFTFSGPHTSSIVSHRRTRPAISKSEFVMRPFGFQPF